MEKYYLIGIKGTGVSALALILKDLGYDVSGYDDAKEYRSTEDALIERGISISTQSIEAMDSDRVVVYSAPITLKYGKETHPELKKAMDMGLTCFEYEKMVGKLTTMFDTITIAGCHGKTTSTAMLAHVLKNVVGCSYLVGDGSRHADKEGKYFVLEACEYRRNFLAYNPTYAVITNIEMDHTDYYHSMDDMILAYQEYANKASKMVIAYGDDPYTHSLEVHPPIFYYGLKEDNDIIAKNVEYRDNGTSFDVEIEGNYYGHFDLPLYGKHMLLNALAVISVCYYERLEAKDVSKSLKTFEGAKRRFKETILGDVVMIDDYAHHPTEVKVTIKAARQKYPNKKLIAIFKPHTFSRVKEFASDFAEALDFADESYVMDINYDRENSKDYEGISADTIIGLLKHGHYMEESKIDELLNYKNAVLLFMSSKEIYLLEDLFVQKKQEMMKAE